MATPLKVIRGEDGNFRDIHGRPMIMSFRILPKDRVGIKKCSRGHNALAEDSLEYSTQYDSVSDQSNTVGKASKPVQLLTFIADGLSANRDSIATRRKIRSHVMKHYKRGGKVALDTGTLDTGTKGNLISQPVCRDIASTELRVDTDLGKERHDAGYSDQSSSVTRMLHQLGNGWDSFFAYPIAMTSYTYTLLHHYLTVVADKMYPSEPDMFSLAVTDAALFHMILCNSAAYVDVLSGDPQCLHTIVQKYEVIRHLQLELQSDVTVTDAWIATVASLVTLECVLGDQTQAIVHRDGLVKMVEMRGGICMLSDARRAKVSIADLSSCIQDDRMPSFPFFDSSTLQGLTLDTLDAPLRVHDGFKDVLLAGMLRPDLMTILAQIYAFTDLVASTHMLENSTVVNHFAAKLRHELLSSHRPINVTTQQEYLNEACRIGLLLYLDTILSSPASGRRDRLPLVTKLKYSVDGFRPSGRSVQELVLWLLFTGWTIDTRKAYRDWFVLKISSLRLALGQRYIIDMKLILMRFLWLEDRHDNALTSLWEQLCNF